MVRISDAFEGDLHGRRRGSWLRFDVAAALATWWTRHGDVGASTMDVARLVEFLPGILREALTEEIARKRVFRDIAGRGSWGKDREVGSEKSLEKRFRGTFPWGRRQSSKASGVHGWNRTIPVFHCTCKSMARADGAVHGSAQGEPETSGGRTEAWNAPGSAVEVPGSTPETTEMERCTMVPREWDVRPCLGSVWDLNTSTSDSTADSSLFQLDRSMEVDLVHALYGKDAQEERTRRERSSTRSTNRFERRKSPWQEKTNQDAWESSHAGTEQTEAWTPRPRPGRTREACLQKKVDDLMEQLSLAKQKKQRAEEELAEQRREKKHGEKKMKVQYEDRLRECRREIHRLKLQLAEANERADTLELHSRPKFDGAAESELEHFERRIQQKEKVILQLKQKESQLLENARKAEEALTNERQTSSELLQNLEQDNKVLRNRLRAYEDMIRLEMPAVKAYTAQNTRPAASRNHGLPMPVLEEPEKKERALRGLEKPATIPDSTRATDVQPLEGSAEMTSLREEGFLRKQVAGLTHICNEQSALLEQMMMQLSRSQVSAPMQDSHLYHHLIKVLDKVDLAHPSKRSQQACTISQHPCTKHTLQEATMHNHLVKEDSQIKDRLFLAHKRITELEVALSESKQEIHPEGRADPALPLQQRVLELELHLQTQEEAWREALATVRKSAAGEVRIIRAHAAAALRSKDQRLATLRGELEELLSIAHACLQPRVV